MFKIADNLVKNIDTGRILPADDPEYLAWLAEGNIPAVTNETLPRSFVPGDLLRGLRSIGKLDVILALLDLPENRIPKTLLFSYPELNGADPEFQAFISGLVAANVLTEVEVNLILKR